MSPKLLLAGAALSAWFALAALVLAWVWPVALLVSCVAGWALARSCRERTTSSSYVSVFVFPVFVALAVACWSAFNPSVEANPFPLGLFVVAHLVAAVAAFAFVRHVIQPGEVAVK